MSNSKSRYTDILIDQQKVTSTTTTKVGNNNEIVMENREEMELEVISQHEDVDEKRSPIQTFAFFDVESSGLKSSTAKARITEISILALSVTDLLKLKTKLEEGEGFGELDQIDARVQNKLTLCVNPSSLIMPDVTDLTGLDNYNLENQSSFSLQTAQILQNFLLHLPKPICLVAHAGLSFDFPLLRSELEKVGFLVQPKPAKMGLGEDLVVVDSLEAFRHIFAEKKNKASRSQDPTPLFNDDDDWNFPLLELPSSSDDQVFSHREAYEGSQQPSASSTPIKNGPSTSTTFVPYNLPITPPNTTSKKRRHENDFDANSSVSCCKKPLQVDTVPAGAQQVYEAHSSDEVRDNDTTPDRSAMPPPVSFQPVAPHKTRKFSSPPQRFLEASRARKRLDFSQTLPQSFSLPNLHQFFFGRKPAVSHGAEPDCLALTRICAQEGPSFVSYAEQNAVRFSSIQKMW